MKWNQIHPLHLFFRKSISSKYLQHLLQHPGVSVRFYSELPYFHNLFAPYIHAYLSSHVNSSKIDISKEYTPKNGDWKVFVKNSFEKIKCLEDEKVALKELLNENAEDVNKYFNQDAKDGEDDDVEEDALMASLNNAIEVALWNVKQLLLLEYQNLQNISSNVPSKSSIILEVRPGVGGEEAGLFAMEIFKMYEAAATNKDWGFHVVNIHSSDDKEGCKEAIANVTGDDVYEYFKYESGTHRVQRVSATDKMGRMHTSTATVVILPKLELGTEASSKIPPHEFRFETMRSSGPGGQSVNKSETAVRVTHTPSKMTVTVRQTSSQVMNKQLGIQILTSRLHKMNESQLREVERHSRTTQIGSGDRSEKIRTYNFQHNRVTDHRCKHDPLDAMAFLNSAAGLDEIVSNLKENEENDIVSFMMNQFCKEMNIHLKDWS